MSSERPQRVDGRSRRLLAAALGVAGVVSWTGGQDTPAPTPGATVPAFRQANQIGVLTIDGPIDAMTLRSLERRVALAREEGANAIVLDIHTPGGELGATLDICHLLKTESGANTVAWINHEAFSAGTIIGLACREIVVAPNARFGDAAPIQIGPTGIVPMQAPERAKMESPILEEVVDSARRQHYDENLVQAFISVGVELWLLQHKTTGERVFVDRNEYERIFGDEPPDQLTPVAPPGVTGGGVQPWFNTAIPMETPPDDAAAAEQERYVATLPPARQSLTDADRDDWALITQVTASDQLLTLSGAEAQFYGLAQATISNDDQLKAWMGAATIKRYDSSWSEGMVRMLTHPIVRGVLIVIFVICMFIEMAAPGVGLFGAAGGGALLLLIGAPYLVGMAQWWDILLIVVGLLLVGLELFVIPGFGVAGICGAVALLAGLVGTFVSDDLSTAAGQGELATGLVTTLTSIFAASIAAWLLSRQFGTLPIFRRLILDAEVSPAGLPPEGSVISAMGSPPPGDPAPGDVGLAATDLRPAGRADFGGKLWDVKSVGKFIDEGRPLRVVAATAFEIQVEEVRE
jgi:membrane-bound ClpP family serine protease